MNSRDGKMRTTVSRYQQLINIGYLWGGLYIARWIAFIEEHNSHVKLLQIVIHKELMDRWVLIEIRLN